MRLLGGWLLPLASLAYLSASAGYTAGSVEAADGHPKGQLSGDPCGDRGGQRQVLLTGEDMAAGRIPSLDRGLPFCSAEASTRREPVRAIHVSRPTPAEHVLAQNGYKAVGGPEQFQLVEVAVEVLTSDGAPIAGAQVRTLSEDWYVRYPLLQEMVGWFRLTGPDGTCVFTVPVGTYSLFAGGGETYRAAHPAEAYFAVARHVMVDTACSVTLRPDAVIWASAMQADGTPLPDGNVYAMASDVLPMVRFPLAGRALGGATALHVCSGSDYAVLVEDLGMRESGSLHSLLARRVETGSSVVLAAGPEHAGCMHIGAYDISGAPGPITLAFRRRDLELETDWLSRADVSIAGDVDLYVSPGSVELEYKQFSDGWAFEFDRIQFDVTQGFETTVNFGGPIRPKARPFLVDSRSPDIQMLLLLEDAFGNRVGRYVYWPEDNWNGNSSLRITRGAEILYEGPYGQGTGREMRLPLDFDDPDLLTYELYVDLGPSGGTTLTGTLVSPDTDPMFSTISTEHFDVHVPAEGAAEAEDLAAFLEAAYGAMADALDSAPTDRIGVWNELCPGSAGWAGVPNMGMWFGGLLAFGVQDTLNVYKDVTRHELGHLFQGMLPAHGTRYRSIGEPHATHLGTEAARRMYGGNVGRVMANAVQDFFVWLSDPDGHALEPIPALQFILSQYIPFTYGWDVHRLFFEIAFCDWGSYDHVLALSGLSLDEQLAALLSFLCGENLAWLFNFCQIKVSEEAVTSGIALLLANRVTLDAVSEHAIRPGEAVHIPVDVVHNVEGFDTFDLGLSHLTPGWGAQLSQLEATVAGGEAAQITLTLAAPGLFQHGAWGGVTLNAVSRADPDISATLLLTAQALLPRRISPSAVADEQPTLIQAGNGRVWLAWRRLNGLEVRAAYSDDGCTTWSPELSLSGRDGNNMDPYLYRTSDDRIWAMWVSDLAADTPGAGYENFIRTNPGGTGTWSPIEMVSTVEEHSTHSTLVERANGDIWIWCGWNYRVSSDGGATWGEPIWAPIWLWNSSLFQLLDERLLLASFESQVGKSWAGLRISADAGLSWSEFVPIARATGELTGLCDVAVSGSRLWYVWDDAGEIFIARSEDGGFTWSRPAQLTHSPERDCFPEVEVIYGEPWVSWGSGDGAESAICLARTDLPAAWKMDGAAFVASPLRGPVPLVVAFLDRSLSEPTSWLWDFGDGASSFEQNPTHMYTAPGYYTVSLSVTGTSGLEVETKDRYVLVTFRDVPLYHWAFPQVMACVTAGIVSGYPDGTYKPTSPVSRDQMAVYISRTLELVTQPYEGRFPDDVPESQWAWPWIEALARQGIVQGFDATHYRPDEVVNRDAMAVYVARSLVGGITVPSGPAEGTFEDVPDYDPGPAHWAYDEIEYCVANEVVAGYDPTHYRPEEAVTRDQMAVYVTRAFRLPM